jgi:hypothetical protein
MSKNNEKWLILGGVAFAAAVVVTIELLRRRRSDPLTQANRLIERCNDRLNEVEDTVASLRSLAQTA